MSYCNLIIKRAISTTTTLNGKRNFRKFVIPNKRGTRIFKQQQMKNPDPDIPIDKRGTRDTGIKIDGKYTTIPEMVPQLIVPDLTNCNLKPYVSYKTANIVQSEHTPQDLFNAIYSKKIIDDYKHNKLNPDNSPMEPSDEEKLTAEEAKLRARQTGSDIF